MTRIMSHEDMARDLLAGAALDYANPLAIDHLRRAITRALQDSFDLGFRAAGGSVPDDGNLYECKSPSPLSTHKTTGESQ